MVDLQNLLLKYMYKDTANVYRSVAVKDGLTDDFNFEMVYENVPCKLSQYGKEISAHKDDRAQHITEDLRLCYCPEIDILENDVIEVEHCGQIFKLIAGTAFKYFSHVELSVRRRKESNQL